jgi:hypothetical protein
MDLAEVGDASATGRAIEVGEPPSFAAGTAASSNNVTDHTANILQPSGWAFSPGARDHLPSAAPLLLPALIPPSPARLRLGAPVHQKDRSEESSQHSDDFIEARWRRAQPGFRDERPPLNGLGRIRRKSRRQRERHHGRDRRLSSPEGCLDGLSQGVLVKLEVPREEPDIEKVLHAAVRDPELHHGFELLGDGRLPSVHAQSRGRHIGQQRGVARFGGSRSDRIAEADIDLKR